MEFNLHITIDLSERLMALLQMQDGANVSRAFTEPEPAPEATNPIPGSDPVPQTEAVSTGMPSFVSEDAKRKWLVEKLQAVGVTIPPRTRTTTLEKWFAEHKGNTATAPPAQGDDLFGGEASAPAQPVYTKEQVTEALKAHLAAGVNDTEKQQRREQIKAKLAEYGAGSVSDLPVDKYPEIVNYFTIGG